MIAEEKLPVIAYDLREISSVITKLGHREFWRQNPNFGHGHLDEKAGSFPQKGKPGTPVFQGQTTAHVWEGTTGRTFLHLTGHSKAQQVQA